MDDAERRAKESSLCDLYDTAPMKNTFGLELSYNEKGQAVFHLPFQEGLCHGLMDVHGGVIATMIDNAGWFTAATEYDTWINTSEITVRLLEPANQEDLHSVGTIIRAGSKICVTSMEVRGSSGRLVATGSGTFIVSQKILH
tara:strand:- start:1484 stop:1909 length:426 start_codon:yes stop_codon:yes gene_type:complete